MKKALDTVRILILADLHFGSVFSAWDPDYILKSGNTIGLNPVQKILWEYLNTAISEVNKKEIDAGVILGDGIDGTQRRNIGRWLVSSDTDDQEGCLVSTLEKFKVKRWYGVTGTEYHELTTSDIHESIIEKLNSKLMPKADPRTWKAGWKDTGFDMNVNGYTLNFAHGSSSSFVYPETVMGRERLFMLSQGELNKCQYADCIFRGHLHIYNEIKTAGRNLLNFPDLDSPAVTSQKACICPGFQAQTVYMKKKSPFKLIPDIGYILVEIDELGVHIKERLFEPISIKMPTVILR